MTQIEYDTSEMVYTQYYRIEYLLLFMHAYQNAKKSVHLNTQNVKDTHCQIIN